MIRGAIFLALTLGVSAVMLSAAVPGAGTAAAAATQFSCTGVKIEPVSMKQVPITVKLNLVSARKIALDLDNSEVKSTVASDDQITLHFRTRDFTGEFFHYTNDLFLIYHSGHLAKLSCTPAQ
jgi:hypothetical protein